jgi:hypothetical protein
MMGYVTVWGGLGFLLTSALVAENERSRIRFERVLGVVGYLYPSDVCVGRQCIGRRCSRLLRKMLTYVEEEEVQSNEALLRLGQRD